MASTRGHDTAVYQKSGAVNMVNTNVSNPEITRAEDMPVAGFPNMWDVLFQSATSLVDARNQLRLLVLGEQPILLKDDMSMVENPRLVVSQAQYVRALAEEIGRLVAELDVRVGGTLQ